MFGNPAPAGRRLALVAAILGSGIVFLDATIVNVALPAIRSSLHGGLADQQWVVEAYLLTLASLLLIGGSLGDLFGRRRVFSAGLVVFGGCSLVCALASGDAVLIGARAAQGVGGALLVPSTLALIMDVFPEGERAAAIGSWTAWTGIATVIGPLGGGALVQLASWRWIFAVNLAPVLITLGLLRRVEGGGGRAGRVDLAGAGLCALGLGGLVFALIEAPQRGWGEPLVLIPLISGAALLVAFGIWERLSPQPMLPLALFRSLNFAAGNLTTFALYAGLGVATFFLVLFLQQVGGYTPIQAGLAMLPITAMMFTLSRRFGRLADRLGPRLFMAAGPLVAGCGLLLLTRAGPGATYLGQILPAVLVFGLGLAGTVAPLTAAVLGAVAVGRSGVASGVNNAVARVANLVAIAAVGAVVASSFQAQLADRLRGVRLSFQGQHVVAAARLRPLVVATPGLVGRERAVVHGALVDASVHAFHVGVEVAAALAFLGALASLVGIRNPHRRVSSAACPGGALVGASRELALGTAAAGGHPVAGRGGPAAGGGSVGEGRAGDGMGRPRRG